VGKESLSPRLPVIAFSRNFCSGSRIIAEVIRSRFGYEIFGYKLINKVAEDMHLSSRIVDRLERGAESTIRRLTDSLVARRAVSGEAYFRSLVRVMRALILQGGVILLGRGSPLLVKENEGLRVSLITPLEQRLENLHEFYGGTDGPAALRKLEETDQHRTEFIQHYFHADRLDPNNFDLTINTDRITPAAAADIIQVGLAPLQM